MQIHLSPRNIRLTAAIHQKAAEKIEQLEALCSQIVAAHIVLLYDDTAKPASRYSVKVHLALAGPDVHADEHDADLYLAMDKVADKLARQLRKRKTKLTDKRRQDTQRAVKLQSSRGMLDGAKAVKASRKTKV